MESLLDILHLQMPGDEWELIKTPFERGSVKRLHSYPGISWAPLLDGTSTSIRDSVIIENDDPTTGYRIRCLVTNRFRLTIYPGTEHGELFDMHEDPWELHNLWYQESSHVLKGELIATLLDRYSQHTPLYPIPPWNS